MGERKREREGGGTGRVVKGEQPGPEKEVDRERQTNTARKREGFCSHKSDPR